jgi:16S rRNA processing protein RimM
LLIGEITAPQGLKGEVRVYAHTDFPQRFTELPRVAVRSLGAVMRITPIESARIQGRVIILKLGGVESINSAEALRGAKLLIPRSWAVELGTDEYYYYQLLGLEVETTTGEALGKIMDIWPTGANDVYETPLALIPATKDMIRKIDLEHGRMVVDARPGLKKHESGE